MPDWLRLTRTAIGRGLRFGRHAGRLFIGNHGILLAGGVAYNTLLSLVPLMAVITVALSLVFDEARLLQTLEYELAFLAPGLTETVMGAVRSFLESREVAGSVGLLILLFFSSIAFRMLEDAIAIIFHRPENGRKRSWWVSFMMPYIYITILAFTLLAVMIVTTAASAIASQPFFLFGTTITARVATDVLLSVGGYVFLVALFTSVYKVLPIVTISLKRAMIGGLVAATLWMGVARLLSYYFSRISLVNVFYGSLGTVIVVLLVMEVAAFIVLYGAQVIAELQHNAKEGRAWWYTGEEEEETA